MRCLLELVNPMTPLKKAIETGRLKDFIDGNNAKIGNKAVFDAAISSMAGKSKPVQKTSYVDDHDD